MSQEFELLKSIAKELAAVRRDLTALRDGLTRQGFTVGKDPENTRVDVTWNPPALRRLGDMITIIAKSNPASAAALQEAGIDAERDVATDPTRDRPNDADAKSDPDPTPRDDDKKPLDDKHWWWPWDDNDQVKKDPQMNPADPKADPKLPDTRDDNNHIEPRPDTPRDGISA